MSYEPKPSDSQPPQYGIQSPPPSHQQPMEGQFQDKSQPTSPPPQQMNQAYNNQYQQPQMQQNHHHQQQQQQEQYPQPQQPAQSGGITMPIASLTQSPAPIQCPSCGAHTMTATTQVVGNTTHGWAAAICCCFCLGCIPYLMSSLKDVEHRCPKCGVHLATWHKSGRTDVKLHG